MPVPGGDRDVEQLCKNFFAYACLEKWKTMKCTFSQQGWAFLSEKDN